jgi:hypothetical protein
MLRKFFMAVLTLALVTGLYAQNEADFEIKQNPDGKTLSIISYKGTVKDLIIPANIYGRDVTIIEVDAFADKDLTSVSVSDKITRISQGAFKNNRIVRLTLGREIQFIGEKAFANNRIIDITLPAKLKFIGTGAFENNQILSLNIPNGVTLIEAGAFAENPLVAVIIPATLAKRTVDNIRGALTAGIAPGAFSQNIQGITLPAGMDETALRGNFAEDFVAYWIGEKKVAGPYIKRGPLWNRATVADRDRYIMPLVDQRRMEVAREAEEKARKEAEEKAAREAEEKAAREAEEKAQRDREATAFNQALQRSGFTANILNDGTVEITGYSVKGATLNIPATIGGKTVTRIGENAFREKISKGEITSVTLPVTLVEIGRNAFANLTSTGKKGKSKLTSVTWGLGLKKIEETAFSENTTLTTIKAGTSQTETTIVPNAISVEFMIAWLGTDKPKTYTKKGNKWE